MKYDDQILTQKIETELERLLKKYVKGFAFSDNYKSQVTSLAYKKLRAKNSITSRDITETLKAILSKSFIDTMRAKPTSNLYKYFFEPYRNIYERSNELLQITPSDETLHLFVSITLTKLFKDAFGLDKEILVTYQKELAPFRKTKKKEKKEVTPISKPEKKQEVKKQSFLLEKQFAVDKTILFTLLPTLENKESQIIRSVTKREERKNYLEYPYIVDKLMKGIRLYFLLKALNYNYTEIIETITLAHQNKNYFEVLANLQNKFLDNTVYKSDTIELEIQLLNSKKSTLAKTLSIFLGLEDYDFKMTTEEIIGSAITWREKLIAKSPSFFQEFLDIPREKIRLIVDCFKNEYALYYEILTKYHGPYLHQIALVEQEDQELYYQAKAKIHEILELEKNGKIIIDSHDKLFFTTKMFQENFKVTLEPNNALSKVLPEIPYEALENIINSFQKSKMIYFRVLLQRHGFTLQEENPLTKEEQRLYDFALKKIKKEYQSILSLNEKNLFEKLEITSEKEKQKVLEVIKTYETSYPHYYQILIKKHGEAFQNVYPLTEKEQVHYLYIFQILKRDLTRPLTLFQEFPNVKKQRIRDVLEVFKEKEPEHYQILVAIHGETLLESQLLTPHNKEAYQKALNCLKNILNNDRKSLYKILEPIPEDQVEHLLKILKRNYPSYYDIIIERFGRSLLQWNKFLPDKNSTYSQAITKLKKLHEHISEITSKLNGISPQELQKYLKEYQYKAPKSYDVLIKKHGLDFTEFNRLETNESRLYYLALNRFIDFIQNYQKNARSLFDRLPLIPQEFIRNSVLEWKTTYPLYYQITTLKHGENLLEEHRISTKFGETYEYVLKKLRNDYRNSLVRDLKQMSKKQILTKTLQENKLHLLVIKAKRAHQSFDEIKRLYQLSSDELSQILANNLLLFADPKEIITEIIHNSEHGLSYLLNSANFLYIMNKTPQILWNQQLNQYVNECPELKPYKFIFTK